MDSESKYVVEYTEKEFQGFKFKTFTSIDAAESWIKDNDAKLYWKRIRHLNPKSSKPKLIVSDNIDLSSYHKIEGFLDTYFETGMECIGLIFQDPTKSTPNPNFDPSQPEDDNNFPKFFLNEGLYFMEDGNILQPEGESKYLFKKDREFASADGYRLSFYPQGFSLEEIKKLFNPKLKRKATLWINKKK